METKSPKKKSTKSSAFRANSPSKPPAPSRGHPLLNWNELIGHSQHQSRWIKLARNNKLPPVLLLVGREGIGKESLLGYLTALLYCTHRSACGDCVPCNRVMQDKHSEVLWVRSSEAEKDSSSDENIPFGSPSKAPLLLADAIKIQEHLQLSAGIQGDYRTVVIPDAHRLSVQAANRLLKILEELPPNCFVMMSTGKVNHLLPTILSRSVKWHITPPSKEESLNFLLRASEGLPLFNKEILSNLLNYFSLAPGPVLRIIESSSGDQSLLPGDAPQQSAPLSPEKGHGVVSIHDFLGHVVSGFSKDCARALQEPQTLTSMRLGSTWGKQLNPPQILEGFERALNQFYRNLFLNNPSRETLDPLVIHQRRNILSEARKLAVRNRILVNSQLLLENLFLTSQGPL